MASVNQYNDIARAEAYAQIGLANSYYLAYRDLPDIFTRFQIEGAALDYGCGTGRSTRFLRDHGFSTIGVDIAEAMIVKAREPDPEGQYHVIKSGDLRAFSDDTFDLVLSNMSFDEMRTMDEKVGTLLEMSRVLKPDGFKVLIAASRDLYLHEWVSWSTSDFPENRLAKAGDLVKIAIVGLGDRQVVEDTLWTEDAYFETFQKTPLRLLETRRPTIEPQDPIQCDWISERTHAPFVFFILKNGPKA